MKNGKIKDLHKIRIYVYMMPTQQKRANITNKNKNKTRN